MPMQMQVTAALCLLVLIPQLLPDRTAATEQGLSESQSRAVWDGGGCSQKEDPQEDSQDPLCQQVTRNSEPVKSSNRRANPYTQMMITETDLEEIQTNFRNINEIKNEHARNETELDELLTGSEYNPGYPRGNATTTGKTNGTGAWQPSMEATRRRAKGSLTESTSAALPNTSAARVRRVRKSPEDNQISAMTQSPGASSPASTTVPSKSHSLPEDSQESPRYSATTSSITASTKASKTLATSQTAAASSSSEAGTLAPATSTLAPGSTGASSAPASPTGATTPSPAAPETPSSPAPALSSTASAPETSAGSLAPTTVPRTSSLPRTSPADSSLSTTPPAASPGPGTASTGAGWVPTSVPGTPGALATTAGPSVAPTSVSASTTLATSQTAAASSSSEAGTLAPATSTLAPGSTGASSAPASPTGATTPSPAAPETPSSPAPALSSTASAPETSAGSLAPTTVPRTTGVSCLNGGKWNGEACECPDNFEGDRCQYVANVCHNGGSWDGLKCQCTILFHGPKCEDVVDGMEMAVPRSVAALMDLSVTVTSQQYNTKLENRSSEEFKNFNTTFTDQMNQIYAGIPEYEGVNITRLRPGSVVVEHEVLLRTNYTPEYRQVLERASQDVMEKIVKATQVQISNSNNSCLDFLLCFNSTATTVSSTPIVQYDPEEECRELAKDYAAYFTLEYKDQKPYCVTPCMTGFNVSLDCHNGQCQLQPSGPRCNCLITATHWYQGETCEWGIQKSLVYGLTGASAVVLLLILVILLVFALHSRRVAKKEKFRVSQLFKWYEDGGRSIPGTIWNANFDIREDFAHLDSIYGNFQPSLDNVDSRAKVRIQRPQVVGTQL